MCPLVVVIQGPTIGMCVFSINSSCSNGNVLKGGGGDNASNILPYVRLDLLTEKWEFSLKMWSANITYTVGEIPNFFQNHG